MREARGLLEVENVHRYAGVRVRVHPEKGVRLPLQPESHWPQEEQVGREGLRRAGGGAGVRRSILALLLLVRVALCHQQIQRTGERQEEGENRHLWMAHEELGCCAGEVPR